MASFSLLQAQNGDHQLSEVNPESVGISSERLARIEQMCEEAIEKEKEGEGRKSEGIRVILVVENTRLLTASVS